MDKLVTCQYCGQRYWVSDGHVCEISDDEEQEETIEDDD